MIELPPEFEKDIQGQNLNLFPIVTIGQLIVEVTDSEADLTRQMLTHHNFFEHSGMWNLFRVGDYIKIDSEYMRVTNFHLQYVFVVRGVLGSDIADHNAGADVYLLDSVEGGLGISTKALTLPIYPDLELPWVRNYKPLLLNIPSIKESMDFENRNYKISNVTLKISNYEYEGERFSDYAGSLINESVIISWVSQSESILEVYKGFVRRYSHDDETCTIQLEDSSQKDLHADVPTARLGGGDEILDKYKLKPIPMVYGAVDKSPVVIANWDGDEQAQGEFYVFADRTEPQAELDAMNIESINNLSEKVGFDFNVVGFQSDYPAYLQVSENGNNGYLLANVWKYGDLWSSEVEKQFSVNGNNSIIGYNYTVATEADGGVLYNPLADNTVQAVTLDEILPKYGEYIIDEKSLNSSITIHSNIVERHFEQILQYPAHADGGTVQISYGDNGIDWEYQDIPSIFYQEGSSTLSFWANSDEDAAADALLQRTTIRFSAPPLVADGFFQNAVYRFTDLNLNISGMDNNVYGNYGYVTMFDELLGGGYNFLAYIPPTYSGSLAYPLTYYTSDTDHSGGDNTINISVLPPINGYVKVDAMEYAIRLERVYHLDQYSFNKAQIFANVNGRTDTGYESIVR